MKIHTFTINPRSKAITALLAVGLWLASATAATAKPFLQFDLAPRKSARVSPMCSELLLAHAQALAFSVRNRLEESRAAAVFSDQAETRGNPSALVIQLLNLNRTLAPLPIGEKISWVSQAAKVIRERGRSMLPPIAAKHASGILTTDSGLVIGIKFDQAGLQTYIKAKGPEEFSQQGYYALDLSNSTDLDLRLLSKFRGLTHLDLSKIRYERVIAGDEDYRAYALAPISLLKELTHLSIADTPVNIALLQGLAELRVLDLHGSSLNPHSLAHIATNHPKLESLDLSFNILELTRWEGELPKIKELARLKNLKELYLRDTRIDDEGAQMLVSMPSKLDWLDLSQNDISETKEHTLKKLKLEYLNFDPNGTKK